MRLVLVVLACAAFALPGATASFAAPDAGTETIGPFTGTGTGLLDRFRHLVTSEFTSDSKDVYKGRFTYSFGITNGIARGSGTGDYLRATWRLDGTHRGQWFGCDVPMRTEPFRVRVHGRAPPAPAASAPARPHAPQAPARSRGRRATTPSRERPAAT